MLIISKEYNTTSEVKLFLAAYHFDQIFKIARRVFQLTYQIVQESSCCDILKAYYTQNRKCTEGMPYGDAILGITYDTMYYQVFHRHARYPLYIIICIQWRNAV